MKLYDIIAPMYTHLARLAMPSNRCLVRALEQQNAGIWLDIGCGDGSLLDAVSKHQITGIDSSLQMIQHAVSNEIKTHLQLADAHQLPFSAHQFDYLTLAHVLSVVDKPRLVLKEAHRVLKPNGICWIQNHDSAGWWFLDKLLSPFSHLIGIKLPFTLLNYIHSSEWEILQSQKLGRFSYFKLITLRRR